MVELKKSPAGFKLLEIALNVGFKFALNDKLSPFAPMSPSRPTKPIFALTCVGVGAVRKPFTAKSSGGAVLLIAAKPSKTVIYLLLDT